MATSDRRARCPFSIAGRAFLVLLIAAMVATTLARPVRPAPPSRLPVDAVPRYVDKFRPLQDDGSTGLQQRRLAGEKAPAMLHAIVLMCDFADSAFYGRPGLSPEAPATSTQSDFYYATHDSLYYAHQMRDVSDYFTAVSDGQFALTRDVLGTIVHLPHPMAYYGNDPTEGEQTVLLAADVVAAVDPLVDFSLYDTVVLIHAGAGEETDILDNSPEQIYSTYLGPEDFAGAVDDSVLTTPYIPTDDQPAGTGVQNVLVLPENEFQDPYGSFKGYFGSLGVYCFEVGLRLGMLSLSDFTPSGHPDSQGIGEFGLMGYGLFVGAGFIPPHPIAFNKLLMGWLDPFPVDPTPGATWTLGPAEHTHGADACARVDITGREYWLLEYRLQDPDANGIFSFTGDLNGNNVPDFYDADSAYGDGRPTSYFDPATDQREWLTGAEWDFFMSENTARPDGVKGAGSGIYIWHVDEGVIQAAFGAASNLFNADASHKSVDLEEADGIQDLDTRQSSPWLLGGDFDSFRGEDAPVFGPATRPSTETANGARTGIVFDEISDVADSTYTYHAGTDSAYTGLHYADAMAFRCRRAEALVGAPTLAMTALLDGIDLGGCQPLAADLDQDGAGQEVLAVAADGAVVVLDPPSPVPVVQYVVDSGDTVRFRQPAAAGRLAGTPTTGGLDIVVASDRGVHWLRYEGGVVSTQGTDPTGLVTAGVSCPQPAVLWPADGGDGDGFAAERPVQIRAVDRRADADHLTVADATSVIADLAVPGGRIQGPLVVAGGHLWAAAADTAAGTAVLLVQPLTDPQAAPAVVPLPLMPGTLPLAVTRLGTDFAVAIVDTGGRAATAWLDETTLRESHPIQLWGRDLEVRSPIGSEFAFVGGAVCGRAAPTGVWSLGWPLWLADPVEAATRVERAAVPLALTVSGAAGPDVLFVSRDGRLFRCTAGGEVRAGWPLAGPGESAGTPVVADVVGDGGLDLITFGAFDRIAGIEAGQLVTRPVSRIEVFTGLADVGVISVMWSGNPWRADALLASGVAAPGPSGAALVAGTHFCYPNPLRAGPLHVRGQAGQDGQARAWFYNLEGEEVAVSPWQGVVAAAPFEITLDLGTIASGLYVCRLEVESARGGSETSVKTVAVVR